MEYPEIVLPRAGLQIGVPDNVPGVVYSFRNPFAIVAKRLQHDEGRVFPDKGPAEGIHLHVPNDLVLVVHVKNMILAGKTGAEVDDMVPGRVGGNGEEEAGAQVQTCN
jgi:hypothetical protein